MRQLNKLIIIIISMFLLTSSLPSGAAAETPLTQKVGLLSANQEGVSFEINVPWQNLAIDPISSTGADYTEVDIAGWEKTTQPGAPQLPYLTQLIGVPFGVDLSLEVKAGTSHQINLSAPVLPVESQQVDWSTPHIQNGQAVFPETNIIIETDPLIYQGISPYPGVEVEVLNDGVIRGQRIASIAIYPVQYDPSTKSITVVEKLQVSVKFNGDITSQRSLPPSDSHIFENIFSATLMNYQQARDWRLVDQELSSHQKTDSSLQTSTLDETISDWSPPSQSWRIKTKQEGLYVLTKEVLNNAGFPVDTPNPENIKMINHGNEIAIEVILDVAGQVEEILFFAQVISTKYTDDNVYWLTVGESQGARMDVRNGAPVAGEIPEFYTSKLDIEESKNYLTMAPGDDHLDRFLGDIIYPPYIPSWTHEFDLKAPFTGPGKLTINMLGYINHTNNPDHHVVIKLNNTTLADIWWDGITWKQLEVNIPEGILHTANNTLVVTCPNDTGVGYDVVYFDWARLEFPNTFTAQDNQLAFDFGVPGTWQYQIHDFNAEDIVVYDVTIADAPVQITGVSVAADGAQYSASFEDDVTTAKSYIAASKTALLSLTEADIKLDNPSNLGSPINGADYLIVSHSEFLADPNFITIVGELTNLRESQGLRTMMIDVQDIYDEFSFGVVSPYAIRDFLLYAYSTWEQPAPSYVLLIGDGHYDPKNNLGYGRTSYIPPFLMMADPLIGETAADNRYVTLVGNNNMPDMMLGRLAVNSGAEAHTFISKILGYEQSPDPGDWQKQVLFVADLVDGDAGNFPEMSESLLNIYLPDNFSADRVYLGDTHPTLGEARTGIQSSINNGKMLINYTGHGTYTQWASGDGLLNTGDIPLLTNGQKLPVVLAMTCREGYYHFPHTYSSNREALAEVFTRAGGKGAVASWSPSGAGVATGHSHLNSGFLGALFQNGALSIGEATIAGKLRLWGSGYNFDLMDTYLLFGDPAMRFVRGLTAVYDYYQTDQDQQLIVPAENGVLFNDINPDDANLTAQFVEPPSNGSLEFNPDGSFTYTPFSNFYGSDSFTYRASDGVEYSNTATVRIRVLKENNAPTDITLSNNTIYENYPIDTEIGTFSTTDPDAGDTFNYSLVPGVGSDGNSAFNIYRNKLRSSIRFNYEDQNIYTIRVRTTDQWGAWFEKPFTINILDLNDAPMAEDDYFVMEMNTTLVLDESELTANDWDEDGDTLFVYAVYNPIEGSVSLENGAITFIPTFDYVGQAGFDYTISDGNLFSWGHVHITILDGTNSAPSAEDQSLETTQSTPVEITLVATDADGDPLTYSIVDQPTNGTLTTETLPIVAYTPNAGFLGQDSFTFKANDGSIDSNTATVTITVLESSLSEVSIPLYQGWNLVSFNLQPQSTAISDVLTSVAGNYSLVYAWDAVVGDWLIYDPVAEPYANDLEDLDHTMGFWINMTTPDTLIVSGTPPTTTDILLKPGWNLVGYPSIDPLGLPGALEDNGVTDYSSVWAYNTIDADPWQLFDPTAPSYSNTLLEVTPGRGYWIEADINSTWNITYDLP